MAKSLLELGVDVDFKEQGPGQRTALHESATKTTKEAAEMIQFLLLSGADPNGNSAPSGSGQIPRIPALEKGAQNISQHLGMTWDELIDWSKGKRT